RDYEFDVNVIDVERFVFDFKRVLRSAPLTIAPAGIGPKPCRAAPWDDYLGVNRRQASRKPPCVVAPAVAESRRGRDARFERGACGKVACRGVLVPMSGTSHERRTSGPWQLQ